MTCAHVRELAAYLRAHGLRVWSERGEGGWVNVWCRDCGCTHEVTLDDVGEET